jgi:hypothetical protein
MIIIIVVLPSANYCNMQIAVVQFVVDKKSAGRGERKLQNSYFDNSLGSRCLNDDEFGSFMIATAERKQLKQCAGCSTDSTMQEMGSILQLRREWEQRPGLPQPPWRRPSFLE